MDEKIYTLGFAAFPGIGTIRFEKLVAVCGSAQKAWYATDSELIKILGNAVGKKFSEFRKTFNGEKYAKEVAKKDMYLFTPKDKEYPVLLKELSHPPFILFVKGNISLLQNDKTIGVVGTRKVTSYGREVTEMFVADLVAQDVTIVSGMALGVDGIAHTTAVKNNGATIAVLGSGVDRPTPREHVNLYENILEHHGLIVSTFAPGEDASIGSFPARNAIIAGLSQAILVTEGAETSGSLITAQYAKKFDRFVFSVPGQITSHLSKGTNNLIKNGAIAVTSAGEILDRLGIIGFQKSRESENQKVRLSGSPEELSIVSILEQNGPLLFDEIVRKIGKDSKSIGSLLSLMELKGMIASDSDGKYSIN